MQIIFLSIKRYLLTHMKLFYLGGRAFSQPEGLFECDIDAFIIQCQPMNYHLKLTIYITHLYTESSQLVRCKANWRKLGGGR